jgi:hypothetical protein
VSMRCRLRWTLRPRRTFAANIVVLITRRSMFSAQTRVWEAQPRVIAEVSLPVEP